MKKILVIEDDRDISALIKMNLEYAGYSVHQAYDGLIAIELLKEYPDLIILDLNLPEISGLDLLPGIVDRNIPVLILSAIDSVQQKVQRLELGAEDYMVKPFEPLELIARIKVLLRRRAISGFYSIHNLRINRAAKAVFLHGKKLELTYTEYRILEFLTINRGIVFSRSKLLEQIWGYDTNCDTRTVDMHITRLRSKVGHGVIETVYKEGYKIED